MADVAVIGLGPMGAALANALMAKGHATAVWNRTPDKARRFIERGAIGAGTVAEAIALAPVVIVCVPTYATTRELIDTPEARKALRGRVLVQLSTGTPVDANELATWAKDVCGSYLDGAIMAFPAEIGGPPTLILVSGQKHAWEASRPLLDAFGGNLKYLGEKPGAASAFDFALLVTGLGHMLGAAHAASICEAEGIDLQDFTSVASTRNRGQHILEAIMGGTYGNPGASIAVWQKGVQSIQRHARQTGMSTQVPDFISSLLAQAVTAGHGGEHIAALFKMLRKDDA
jgi:3-hydroxyisobutyrate dehydrogenase-like beta-hydroxyacid dehydrogenase